MPVNVHSNRNPSLTKDGLQTIAYLNSEILVYSFKIINLQEANKLCKFERFFGSLGSLTQSRRKKDILPRVPISK